MACRFIEADDELIELLKCESENKNTKRSTGYWKRIFEKWAKTRGKEEQLESYDIPELNEALSQFYAELRKENGQDYEPDSLKVMQAALDRHLRSKNYPKSIVRDTVFLSSRKVLEGKARKLREQGMGKRPNKAKSLTKEEEEILWQNGQLGNQTPRSLINTMWWLLTMNFGLRGRQEHHDMMVEDFSIEKDDDGVEFITFSEGPTKTRQGGLRVKPRLATPKMFATGEKRCPVALFKQYLEKRPEEMKKTGPFYLAVIDKPQTSAVWYKKTPMGKNTINNIMKTMKEDSPLKDVCPEKKLTNHSARKTVVKKLKSSGIPKCEIKNITGHNSEQGLDDYDSGDENEQKIMSNIIDNAKPASTSRQVLHPLSSVQTQSRSASSHVYNFSHCNVTLNVAGNHSLQSSLSQSKRAYKRIMLQDSDSD